MSGYFVLSDGRTVTVKDGFLLGRASNCDLPLDDTKASRRHARVILEGGVAEIEDLESSNGTLLNGKPVTRRMLRDGDAVQIGTTVFTFKAGQPASASGGGSTATGAGRGSAGGAPSSPVFDDDDELFGGDAPPSPSAATAPTRIPDTPPAPAPAPLPPEPPSPKPQPPQEVLSRRDPEPVPVAPKKNVVEFADEIIEVRKPAAKAMPQATSSAGGPGPVVAQKPKVLQFSKNRTSSNVLGDDVGQMSGGMRALVFAAVLAGMVGLAWLAMKLVR